MMAWSSKYSIEFWDKHGNQLADFSGKAYNRQLVLSRNQPDDLSFSLDLNSFEDFCRRSKLDPKDILKVGSTEVRFRRKAKYLGGGQLVYTNTSISAQGLTIDCRVKGFLWLLSKRYTGETDSGLVNEVFSLSDGTAKSRTDMLWQLISQSQALPNGDFGITRGLTGGSTTLKEKTYRRTNLLNAAQNMTELDSDPIDIEITYDKVLNTYEHIGSNRPDVVFEYPGNIVGLEVADDATDLWNEVIGLGAGAADGTQATYFAEDLVSQTEYQLRQDILNTNATDNSDGGLTDAAEARKQAKSVPIKIPVMTINGNKPPYPGDYGIGDRVTVKVNGYQSLSNINGTYRIEKLTLTIDDSDNEVVKPEVSTI